MSKTIDCLIIGHNEMDFREYEKKVRQMGIHSGAYRDLNLNFLTYNRKPAPASEIFNLFCCSDEGSGIMPINMLDTFSATIAYLGTFLDRRGFSFDYVNSFQDQKEALAEKLLKEDILAIAITTTLYVSVLPILEIVDFIKRYDTAAKIIVGGPFVSTQYRTLEKEQLEYVFKSIGADVYVNSSQGEAALVEILGALKKNLPLKSIANIYYRTNSGYRTTPVLKENNRLSENMVNWNLFAKGAGEHVSVRTSISCPFSCAFCGFPEHAGDFQTAGVEAIQQELNGLSEMNRVKSVNFIDDTFNIPARRFKEILRMMIRNKYTFKWHSYYRCQYADRETVELMKESGCEGVYLGIESGSDPILKNMNKAVTADKYLRGIALLKEYDIVTHGNFIIGFPGETDTTVRETLDFIKESGLDFFRVQLWYAEPITPIWKSRDKYNIQGDRFEWNHNTMDSAAACDWVERIFLSMDVEETPVWLPQYNFNFFTIWHLIHQGMPMDRVKDFLRAFNRGIGEKLSDPSKGEISFDVIRQIKETCRPHNLTNTMEDTFDERENTINVGEAEFDFTGDQSC